MFKKNLQTYKYYRFIFNKGGGYTTLPTVSVTSSTGSNANIKAYGDEVGKIVKVKTVELGRGYENSPTPPTLGFFNNVIVTNVSGTFIATQYCNKFIWWFRNNC